MKYDRMEKFGDPQRPLVQPFARRRPRGVPRRLPSRASRSVIRSLAYSRSASASDRAAPGPSHRETTPPARRAHRTTADPDHLARPGISEDLCRCTYVITIGVPDHSRTLQDWYAGQGDPAQLPLTQLGRRFLLVSGLVHFLRHLESSCSTTSCAPCPQPK